MYRDFNLSIPKMYMYIEHVLKMDCVRAFVKEKSIICVLVHSIITLKTVRPGRETAQHYVTLNGLDYGEI